MAAWKRWIAAFDLHGDMQEPSAVNAFHRFVRDYKPHYRILGGDAFDFRPLRGKASVEEKRESLKEDFDAGLEFIEQFRPDTYLLGNHCLRVVEAAERNDGPLSDHAIDLLARISRVLDGCGGRLLPYDKSSGVLTLGRLNFVHGFYAGESACRKHAQIYGPVVFGHVHSAEHVVLPSYDGRREAWSSPCLCKRAMKYNAKTPSTLRYDSGWVYGLWNETGYHVETAKVVDGKVIVASDFKVLAA